MAYTKKTNTTETVKNESVKEEKKVFGTEFIIVN